MRELTAEEWARAILEDAPPATRTMLRRGCFALGVRLGSPEDERLVLGWPVRRRTSEFALLATSSRLGMEAEVLLKRERDALLFATLMQLKEPHRSRGVDAVLAPASKGRAPSPPGGGPKGVQ